MKIAIIGTRGIPAKYGGFETFAEECATRLGELGFEMTVVGEAPEGDVRLTSSYKGVNLIFTGLKKTGHPVKYYYRSIKLALNNKSDIIVIAGVGGAIFYFLKFFYPKTLFITNTDGIEHIRNKWSKLKRLYIKICEDLAVRMSDYLIADSGGIKDYLIKTYGQRVGKKTEQIEYGSPILSEGNSNFLTEYDLRQNEYWLVVSRLEPENNVDLIIRGYLKANAVYPLVIVGNLADTEYVRQLQTYNSNGRVRFLNGIYDKDKLSALRYFATGYLHGHSVGGTNPSLLEAMGHGNIIVAHDNVFNREVTAEQMFYFSDETTLAGHILRIENLESVAQSSLKKISVDRIKEYYNWERISKSYADFFLKISSLN